MIKRTPQEIADFFGCYVVQDRGSKMFNLYLHKPTISMQFGWWTDDDSIERQFPVSDVKIPSDHDWTHLYEPRLSTKSENSVLDTRNQPETAKNSVITSDSGTNQQEANYQKTMDSDNKPDSYYQDSPISDNKPGHASEVFIHKEYNVVKDETLPGLAAKVAHRMKNGWKLQGGVAVEHLPIADGYADDGSYFYQAMVRGV